jgi:hypothetical protein
MYVFQSRLLIPITIPDFYRAKGNRRQAKVSVVLWLEFV